MAEYTISMAQCRGAEKIRENFTDKHMLIAGLTVTIPQVRDLT
ncbi:MAG: hypothetical protein OXE92_02970 [Bacteroidetes bacterium]|nr:hypothetical protein [Bacteroidota bacterium]